MGAWGTEVLDNDTAADWFGDLFERTGFRDRVVAGLQSSQPEEARAAAWVIAQLGRVYAWPIEHLDQDKQDAIEALRAMYLDDDWIGMWDDPAEIRRCLGRELRTLGAKKPARSQATPPRPKKTARKTNRKTTTRKSTPRAAQSRRSPAVLRTSAKLTYDDGKSKRFWEISVRGASYTVCFGRIGTAGQTRTTTCGSTDEAKRTARRLISKKLAKGYR